MPITLKTIQQIELMRRAGALAATIVEKMRSIAHTGITTHHFDDLVRDELSHAGAVAPVKGHPGYPQPGGFPGHCCISVNDEVLHGVPGPRQLEEGDVVTLDVGLMLEGFCASRAVTIAVGAATPEAQRLLHVTEDVLDAAIRQIGPGVRWSNVATLIQSTVESNGYKVVREYVGHGIGRRLIEEPRVPNYPLRQLVGEGLVLKPGMTFTVEPMAICGGCEIQLAKNGCTVLSCDGSISAHARHTVAVTEQGVDVLTRDHQSE